MLALLHLHEHANITRRVGSLFNLRCCQNTNTLWLRTAKWNQALRAQRNGTLRHTGPKAGVLRRHMDIFSFIECANRTRSLPMLFDLLVSCASQEGFTEVAYGALTYAEPVRLPDYQPPAIAVNFPASWCDRYFERKYYEI